MKFGWPLVKDVSRLKSSRGETSHSECVRSSFETWQRMYRLPHPSNLVFVKTPFALASFGRTRPATTSIISLVFIIVLDPIEEFGGDLAKFFSPPSDALFVHGLDTTRNPSVIIH